MAEILEFPVARRFATPARPAERVGAPVRLPSPDIYERIGEDIERMVRLRERQFEQAVADEVERRVKAWIQGLLADAARYAVAGAAALLGAGIMLGAAL